MCGVTVGHVCIVRSAMYQYHVTLFLFKYINDLALQTPASFKEEAQASNTENTEIQTCCSNFESVCFIGIAVTIHFLNSTKL